jgi:hypothetical protein
MSKTVIITLAIAGTDTGPFDIYSNADSYTTPFVTGVSKAALLAGYTSTIVPDAATSVRVKSNSIGCTNYVDMVITNPTPPDCTFGTGSAEIYSLLTNGGSISVEATIKKNGSTIDVATVPYGGSGNAFLSGATFSGADILTIVLDNYFSLNMFISNPYIFLNGGPAIPVTSISGEGTTSVTLTYNSIWGLETINSFTLTFSATP